MKSRTLLSIALLLSALTSFGQVQKTLAKFIVTDARINNVDVTPDYLVNKAYFVLYRQANSTVNCFGSVMSKSDSQSYGTMYDIEVNDYPATESEYEKQVYSFKWSYYNTYDKDKGTASVRLIKTFKPAGVAFDLTIVPSNLDILSYKGYMEGSLKDIE